MDGFGRTRTACPCPCGLPPKLTVLSRGLCAVATGQCGREKLALSGQLRRQELEFDGEHPVICCLFFLFFDCGREGGKHIHSAAPLMHDSRANLNFFFFCAIRNPEIRVESP